MLEAGRLYQKWFHGQPLSLFNPRGFLESLGSRDSELLLAIRAVACRFPPGVPTLVEQRRTVEATSGPCRRMVMERVLEGRIRLSTLQSLCLLSLLSFTGEHMSRTPPTNPMTMFC